MWAERGYGAQLEHGGASGSSVASDYPRVDLHGGEVAAAVSDLSHPRHDDDGSQDWRDEVGKLLSGWELRGGYVN